MKLITILLATAMLINWEPDFEKAKAAAKEHHQLILLNFSGSDWCGPCIMMRKEYFENEEFTRMANENLVLVNADFPRKKKNIGTPDLVRRNEELAEKYNKTGNFPFTLLLDAEGKVLKTWNGKPEVPVEKWTQEIKTICDARK